MRQPRDTQEKPERMLWRMLPDQGPGLGWEEAPEHKGSATGGGPRRGGHFKSAPPPRVETRRNDRYQNGAPVTKQSVP